MVFDADFNEEITQQLIAAISFALESDAEVLLDEVKQIRKVINTYTYSFHGQFAAGEVFGEFYGQFSVKDNLKTLQQMKFKFGDSDTESIIKCNSGQTMLNGIANAYNIYRTRKSALPRIYPELVKRLELIEKIAEDTKVADKILYLTAEIREMFGTDIEIAGTLPAEKEG
ncbi:hypothetical protein [Fibrobacter sp.]|uniref:hypothetical protein n=1 Tax=Fibrobacter sp. TaxID=35828 RepID=UPI003868459E